MAGRNYKDLSGAWGAVVLDVSATDAVLPAACRGIYIGVAGDVTVDLPDATGITFENVPVGVLPVQATRVYTGTTTALSLIALF
jgi:hypothetical protein